MRSIVPAALVVLAGSSAASAQVVDLISNLNGPTLSSTLFGPGSTTQFKAAGWTMPAGPDYFLTDVTLDLSFVGSGLAVVEIWSGAGAPMNSLMTLTSDPQGGAGQFSFTPPSPLVLEAGQTYWAHVTAGAGSENFSWIASSEAPSGLATSAGYNFNGNPSSFMNKYAVRGEVVPVPATAALLGLTVLGAARRRR